MEAVPPIFVTGLVAITGLIFGSFVTLAAYRLPRGEKIGWGRSRCTSCGHMLGSLSLVPLFSWLWSRGRCRYCSAGVSARYPLTECLQALLFLWVYAAMGISAPALAMMLMTVCLLVMVMVDFEWKIIPDEVQMVMFLLGIAFHALHGTPLADVLTGLGIGAAIGLGLYYGYGRLRGIEILGFGDVKFLMVAGLWMASAEFWPPFLFYAGFFGILTALWWRITNRGERFPFGPALAFSLLLLLLTQAGALFFWTVGGIYR